MEGLGCYSVARSWDALLRVIHFLWLPGLRPPGNPTDKLVKTFRDTLAVGLLGLGPALQGPRE